MALGPAAPAAMADQGGSMRHFEFHEMGSLGLQLGRGRYPIEIREVDEGTPAHQQGVPPNSVMVRVNGQPLEPNDGEDVREQVKKDA